MIRRAEILVVDDNPGDVRLVREALQYEGCAPIKLHVCRDGVEAEDFLYRRGDHGTAPRPDLIVLDLNMPRKSGRAVLADIKADETLRTIPVIVLSTSDAEKDVLESYRLHANCYIKKPVELDRFIDAVRGIEAFWLGTARLPEGEDGAAR